MCALEYRRTAPHTHWYCSVNGKKGGEFLIVYRECSSLARDLGVDANILYAVSNSLDTHYRSISLPKRGGGTRTLSIPDQLLKTIQRRITQTLLVHMPISPHATAYRYGGSTRRNAAPHVGQPFLLKLDIQHFFDSILYSTVKDRAFPPEIYAEPLRILLTMLCYHRQSLPQGVPSSPAITNIILSEFDQEVAAWCGERQIRYTRYCDDMTFSGRAALEAVVPFVQDRLRSYGFFLNPKKTSLIAAGQRQVVTGLVVNEKLGIPSHYLRTLRQEIYYCRRYGVSGHLAHLGLSGSEAQYLAHLLGKVNYVLQVTPERRDFQQARAWLLDSLASRAQ